MGGAGTARVSWPAVWPGTDNRVTGYTVTTVPGGTITVGPDVTSTTVTGLVPTKTYTIRVHAGTTVGDSAPTATTLYPSQLALTSPASVPYRKATTLRGRVTQRGAGVAGLTVTLQERYAGQTAWTRLATAKTDKTGAWSVTVRPTTTGSVRATIAGGYGLLVNFSPVRPLSVTYTATIKASRATATTRQKVKISGGAQPAWANVKVTLQRLAGKRWVTVTTGKTTAKGAYAFSRTFARGTWTLRVQIAGGTANASGVSGTVKLKVR
jgi:hypothetical protein